MPKIIDKEKKTAEISEAALKVFGERGFSKTRMEDIAKEAGIGKGTLYEYFRDKVDILNYVVNQFFDAFLKGIIDVVKTETKPAEKLLSLIDFALQNVAEWEDHCAIYIEHFSSVREDEERFLLSGQYEAMKKIIIDLISECQKLGDIDLSFDPEVSAELLASIYDGLIVHRLLEGRKMEIEPLRKTLMMIIEGGLFRGK
jgi:AcrR family transcriptional regulator